jgi:tRNA-dihydrouridine synthase B
VVNGCESASQNATPASPAFAPGAESIDVPAVARATRIDPRIEALVPGFDAPFFQAGLAGYSDAAMRIIARRHGCPYCVTEALLDRTLLAGGRGFAKADLGEIEDNVPGGAEDHPLAGQIMGSTPEEMAAAAVKMIEQGARHDRAYKAMAWGVWNPAELPTCHRLPSPEVGAPTTRSDLKTPTSQSKSRWHGAHAERDQSSRATMAERTFATIDVNLACPVKKIKSKARGGHWLREPDGAIEILRAVRDAVPATVPCTVKLRRSYDDTPEMAAAFEKIFDAAYEIGFVWATVHARTVEQKYIGPSRWTVLRDLCQRYPDRIVFGSGDIWNVHDIFRMIAYTGVKAVSVARGCIGNPWVFRQARELMAGKPPTAPTIAEQRAVLEEHFTLSAAIHGEENAGKMMRKFGVRFATHHPDSDTVRSGFIRCEKTEDWLTVLRDHYQHA